MRIAPGLMAGLLLAQLAHAAAPARPAVVTPQPASTAAADAERSRMTRLETALRLAELEDRANQLYPRRRDAPLRYLNITDGEVREVQLIARKQHMPDLINISPVIEGCPCEEGAFCTDQVYITGHVEGRTLGLQLSRSKNLWTVGVVQKWWLEYAALQARAETMSYRSFQEARGRLLLEFPMCAQTGKPENTLPQVAEAPARK
jgi:hypothetical protein